MPRTYSSETESTIRKLSKTSVGCTSPARSYFFGAGLNWTLVENFRTEGVDVPVVES